MRRAKNIALFALLIAIGAYFVFDLRHYLTLDYLKSSQDAFEHYYRNHPFQSIGFYFGLYVLAAALSLPGVAVLIVAAGAMFDFLLGTIIVSLASTIGATIAFMISRHFLHDWFKKNFRKQFDAINRGFEDGGALYLFSLRLLPGLPYFVTNLGMGVTDMRTWSYCWATLLGLLPGTMVYVNAGTQLADLDSLSDIMSPTTIASFGLLAAFPLVAKGLVRLISKRRAGKKEQRA
jgi:uncharacterized membrane protein YdjX (TVP38/TMEM64 family)